VVLAAVARVLRLVFSPPEPTRDQAPAEGLDEPTPREVEFVAYTDDCALVGRIRLNAERLTDLLNGADEVELVDIGVLSLRTGQLGGAERITLPRAELFAVMAQPPRGNPARRRRTREHPVAFGSGRYLLHGHVHTRPGADPLVDLGRRPPMIPLTDATIRYAFEREWHCDQTGVLVVNRDRADWARAASDLEMARWASDLKADPEWAGRAATQGAT
jgi:hypothetical protein